MKNYLPVLDKGLIKLKICFTIVSILLFAFSQAQTIKSITEDWIQITVPPLKNQKINIDCKEINSDNCNHISNNTFTPIEYNPENFDHFSNPFQNSLVPSWLPSHGTPNIHDAAHFTIPPPFEGLSYCRMAAWVTSEDGYKNNGEGVVQNIPALKKDNRYAISFFKRLTYKELPLDNFYIVLMRCGDYKSFGDKFSYHTPQIPENSQTIYCEKGVSNIEWEQVFETFVAKDDYDMIWFFPKMSNKKEEQVSEILFSYPELINITDFKAGPSHLTPDFNESILIGPEQPNCSVLGATFTWTSPSGVVTNADNSQTIPVDLSNIGNFGLWTLSLTVPGAVATDNVCSEENSSVIAGVTVLERPGTPVSLDCSPIQQQPGCNLIINNNFNPLNYNSEVEEQVADPFSRELIPSWNSSHGTPNIYDGVNYDLPAPIPPAAGYAGMGIIEEGSATGPEGEGIVQKISALNPGKKYSFSFFIKRHPFRGGADLALADFYIVLMKCEDYHLMDHSSFSMPVMPVNSQIIYCERDVQNENWYQNVFSFQPDAAYDMIWIFPKINPGSPNPSSTYLLFAYPELIDISNFSAGVVTPASPVSPNCNVTIGPVTPNCSFTNAIYTWYGPNGQVHSSTSQQLVVNTADVLNAGVWTLQMTSPTNNSSDCGAALLVSANVYVPFCENAPCNDDNYPQPPAVTTTVKIRLGSVTNFLKSTSTPGHYCFSPPSVMHDHYPYFNLCDRYYGLFSGYMPADNNMPSYESFIIDFPMNTMEGATDNSYYLNFEGYDFDVDEPCKADDILNVNLKLFHKPVSPTCNIANHWETELNLSTSHSGNNGFFVQRVIESVPRNLCSHRPLPNMPFFNYDNLPMLSSEITNIQSSTSSTQDYTIDVTQMVKNSVISNSQYIGFLFKQSQTNTYNNIFFEGAYSSDGTIHPGESYLELTYVKRPRRITPCTPTSRPSFRNWKKPINSNEKENISTSNKYWTDKNENNQISLYPNPASNEVVIKVNQENITNIEIKTITGALIKKKSVNPSKTVRVDISNLRTGIYICAITTGSSTFFKTFQILK
jgi:Secretion system C-terminal sorting domain